MVDLLSRQELIHAPTPLFDGLLLMYNDRLTIDGVTLLAYFRDKGWLAKIGGYVDPAHPVAEDAGGDYLKQILQSGPNTPNATYYAGIVAEKYEYRKLISMIDKAREILDEYKTPAEMATEIEELVSGIEPVNVGSD